MLSEKNIIISQWEITIAMASKKHKNLMQPFPLPMQNLNLFGSMDLEMYTTLKMWTGIVTDDGHQTIKNVQ